MIAPRIAAADARLRAAEEDPEYRPAARAEAGRLAALRELDHATDALTAALRPTVPDGPAVHEAAATVRVMAARYTIAHAEAHRLATTAPGGTPYSAPGARAIAARTMRRPCHDPVP